ncbi:AMP-binding protein [Methylophaga sp.]|uniref:AMP-binding protein n=1 Tax=Methylophaga sp. TaxID=2024840 RepID=UPI002726A617|nr:AMP-binding protein [Methylophaga sp.]MDO8825406.1 AMP-binding protein [Methylophaga sp.]
MMYINDDFYDNNQFGHYYRQFDAIPLIRDCRGHRLAVCLQDTAQWIALVLYLKERGGSVVPLPATLPIAAARRTAIQADSHLLVYQHLEQIEVLENSSGSVTPGLVQFSSGTTGAPKCIERSWSDINQELQHYNIALRDAQQMNVIVCCPVTHSYGLLCGVLASFKRGQQPIILTELNPKYVLKKLQQVSNSLLYSSPTMLDVLAKLMPPSQSFHAVMTSGSMMSVTQFKTIGARTQYLFQQYGCSEAGCISLTSNCQSVTDMGKPLTHFQLKAGSNAQQPEEIIVKTVHKDIFTRDLGYLDSQGNLHFVARLDDTINVAGINVYPQEVESVLLQYPDINEAVVYKRADTFAGERVCLKFTADSTINIRALRDWCATELSPYQIPLEIEQVTQIPKLANGKINRRELTEIKTEQDKELLRA